MSEIAENYLENVRDQYEDLPYPPRDPKDDENRIMVLMNNLPIINHRCFAGQQKFDENFRMLVAGGGTGDAAIYHGEELKKNVAVKLFILIFLKLVWPLPSSVLRYVD